MNEHETLLKAREDLDQVYNTLCYDLCDPAFHKIRGHIGLAGALIGSLLDKLEQKKEPA